MKKFLYPLGILTTALGLSGALATPASAHVDPVYFGDPPIAWAYTNSAHTRVGVEDLRCDGLWARVDVRVGNSSRDGWVYDDCDPGGKGEDGPAGLTHIRVCVEGLSCTPWNRIT